jgi:hypothetical protein
LTVGVGRIYGFFGAAAEEESFFGELSGEGGGSLGRRGWVDSHWSRKLRSYWRRERLEC